MGNCTLLAAYPIVRSKTLRPLPLALGLPTLPPGGLSPETALNVFIKGAGMLVRTARPSSASTPRDLGLRGPFEEAAWGVQLAFAPGS